MWHGISAILNFPNTGISNIGLESVGEQHEKIALVDQYKDVVGVPAGLFGVSNRLGRI